MNEVTRRELLLGAVAACVAPIQPRQPAARQAHTRLILLGTGGGPTPKKAVSAPATLIIANDTPYVVDCGDGVARQWVSADVSLLKLRHIFITHQHSDHNADYGNLILLAWATGLATRVDTWGPPPLVKMTKLFLEMNEYDIRTRVSDEGRDDRKH
jgi:ribonuclease BN (tRNA processing enzyme)